MLRLEAYADPYRDVTTLLAIRQFEEGLSRFARDFDRFPTTAEGLGVLTKSQTESGKQSPELPQGLAPIDAWGTPLIYLHPPIHGPGPYDLYSAGANKVDDLGRHDDITSWSGIPRRFYPRPTPWSLIAIGTTLLAVLLALVFGIISGVRALRRRAGS